MSPSGTLHRGATLFVCWGLRCYGNLLITDGTWRGWRGWEFSTGRRQTRNLYPIQRTR